MTGGIIRELRAFFLHRLRWRTAISREQYLRYHTLLSATSAFYRHLSDSGKAKAMHRTVAFMRAKRFEGQGMEVTDSQRLLVAFAAVKLTFGLERYLIPYLHSIYLYPSSFYSRLAGAEVKGLATEAGAIYLSWKDVMAGIMDGGDGLHLAVHEMAHALKINTIKGKPDNDRFAFYLSTWMREADRIRRNQPDDPFLREYGQVNLHEFFAVCMENFIERPMEFSRQEPELFHHTCYLLNQDPLEPRDRLLTEDRLREATRQTGIAFPNRPAKDYTHHAWHWSYTLLLLSVFCSPFALLLGTAGAHVPFSMWHAWLLASAIGGVICYRGVVTFRAMPLSFYPVFVLMGVGPLLLSAVLLADRTVIVSRWEQTHRIVRADRGVHDGRTLVVLENMELDGWEHIRTFPDGYAGFISQYTHAHLHASFGQTWLGIIRCEGRRILIREMVDGKERVTVLEGPD